MGEPSKRKKFWVDTLALVSFSLVLGALLDWWVGMTWMQMAINRAFSIPGNVATGGLQGICVDVGRKWIKPEFLADTISVTVVQVFGYIPIIFVSAFLTGRSVTWHQVWYATEFISVSSLFIGRALGLYLNFLRR
ncbi:MAG: L-alanine exporter AlaE, partial [Patescibacteria group bacterium]|nr:L-alanine exporter AlaE [Patescibacteria group bacterium]